MASSEAHVPVAPENLRPGRVVIADIAVTLVDLYVRDFIQVEEVPGADAGSDWSLRQRPATASPRGRASLLGYEETLLVGLPFQRGACSLSSLPGQVAHLLDTTRSAVVRDSVRRGWLRHLDHHQRTERTRNSPVRSGSSGASSGTSFPGRRLGPFRTSCFPTRCVSGSWPATMLCWSSSRTPGSRRSRTCRAGRHPHPSPDPPLLSTAAAEQ